MKPLETQFPMIIADVGSNHRGLLDLALKQISAAKKVGATHVKFQLYSHEELYGVSGDISYPFDPAWLAPLRDKANEVGIGFMCTAFSPGGVHIVDPYVDVHKVSSCEMKHVGILNAIVATNKPWIVSIGAAHYKEVEWIIERFRPSAILECVVDYPAGLSNYNLGYLSEIPITKGVSDHTEGNELAAAAIPLGATIFEKHFDALYGQESSTPDTCVSLGSDNFFSYAQTIRIIWDSLHVSRPKYPSRAEDDAQLMYRRRLIVTRSVKKGDILKMGENFGIFRSLKPDTKGAAPESYAQFDGKTVNHDMEAGEPLWFGRLTECASSYSLSKRNSST